MTSLFVFRPPLPFSRAHHSYHQPPLLPNITFFPPSQKPQSLLRQKFKRQSAHLMASSNSPESTHPTKFTQLNTESDFEALLSTDGYISICGFGSLLSERSARSTFPDLINFRIGRLTGFRRVFGHAAPIFFERGIANAETKVTPETLQGEPFINQAVLCGRYSDEEYFQVRCKGSQEVYYQRYGRYNIQTIWRDDILPCRVYLRHCVLAAKNLGDIAYNNFLDHTFLGDRRTTIRGYLATEGSGIMEEEPPEQLKSRYGG